MGEEFLRADAFRMVRANDFQPVDGRCQIGVDRTAGDILQSFEVSGALRETVSNK